MELILTGKSTEHLVKDQGHWIHQKALPAWQTLRESAGQEGFDIQAVSIFRSYERQLTIWNEKAKGLRPLQDEEGNIIEHSSLSQNEILSAILLWSAIPGAGRHHWGTELDIYDQSALGSGETIQLTPQEVEGPFAPMHTWLDQNLHSFDFFRPYDRDLGGVSVEKWHLSYAPVSQLYFKEYDFELFEKVIANPLPKLELRELIWQRREEVFNKYVRNISQPSSPSSTLKK